MDGWDLHPLKNAALPRRTPKADIARIAPFAWIKRFKRPKLGCVLCLNEASMTSDIGAWLEGLGLGRYADPQSDSLPLQAIS